MGFEILREKLGWPEKELVFKPKGEGVKINHAFISEKIKRYLENIDFINVGILTANPNSEDTGAILSIVCEFNRPMSTEQTRELHRITWNLSKSPLLIIIEPIQIRAWSCWEKPEDASSQTNQPEIQELQFDNDSSSIFGDALHGLHYIELISGNTFKRYESKFKFQNGAEYLLLQNLKEVRNILEEEGLKKNKDIIHDLLARIIFIQFLFDKKDSQGYSALNAKELNKLSREKSKKFKLLSKPYKNLSELLENHADTYRLFQYLNHKFNGDLFPGKAKTKKEREAEWKLEKDLVKPEHLKILSEFVSGKIEIKSKRQKQQSLWKFYNFDAIPLEFISNIYEEFVNNSDQKGTATVYTPSFLVDFILDGVLPWKSKEWNIKVLDPSCGSGIFLVKVYQRLIHRWKLANNGKHPSPMILRNLLVNNIFGVDKHQESVRVASFSLYLAMLDEIEPRKYWNREEKVKFPILRNTRIIHSDFFADDIEGFRTIEDSKSFDLIVGNAPWGKNSITPKAVEWANSKEHKWSVKYGDIGPLFLTKSALLIKDTGLVSMIQPAGTLLFDQVDTAIQFREKFFESYTISEIVNLSPVRKALFKGAKSPACCITFSSQDNQNKPVIYINVKPFETIEDGYRLFIDPYDIHQLTQNEIIEDSTILISLIWGQRRDYELIARLKSKFKNIKFFIEKGVIKKRQGIIRGDRQRIEEQINNKKIFELKDFPKTSILFFDSNSLANNNDLNVHSRESTDYSAFEYPQILIKQSWIKEKKRFQSRFIIDVDKKGILCRENATTIHTSIDNINLLYGINLLFNSSFSIYYLLETNSSFASYREKITVDSILDIPLPTYELKSLDDITSYEQIDSLVKQAFNLKDSEQILIDDLFNFTLPDFKGDSNSPGRQRTNRNNSEITAYCDYLIKILKGGFGKDKKISATIFTEEDNIKFPYRLVALHLDFEFSKEKYKLQILNSENLWSKLHDLANKQDSEKGIFYNRISILYDSMNIDGKNIPTIYIMKPDQKKYWLRSIGLRDGDSIYADIMNWENKDA